MFGLSYQVNGIVVSGFVTNDLKRIGSEIEKKWQGSFILQDFRSSDKFKPKFRKTQVEMKFAFGFEQHVQECKNYLDTKFDTSGWLRLETRISDVPSKVMLFIAFL